MTSSLLTKVMRTKPPRQLIDEAYEPDRQMKKTLSARDLIAFGVGACAGVVAAALVRRRRRTDAAS